MTTTKGTSTYGNNPVEAFLPGRLALLKLGHDDLTVLGSVFKLCSYGSAPILLRSDSCIVLHDSDGSGGESPSKISSSQPNRTV